MANKFFLVVACILFLFTGNSQNIPRMMPPSTVTYHDFNAPQKAAYKTLDATVSKNLPGNWKVQNSTMNFTKDGSLTVKFDNGKIEIGRWHVKNRILKLFYFGDEDIEDWEDYYYVIYFDEKKAEYKSISSTDDRIWTAIKQAK